MSACRAARWVALACLAVPWRTPAAASDAADVPLVHFLDSLRRAGVAVIYSDALVRPGMSVRRLPQGAPRQQLDVVLADFGLQAVQGPGRSLLIVRAPRATSRVRPDATGAADRAVALQEIVISASRYELLRQGSGQGRYLGAADIVRSPDIGDDPLRMLARLPGAAFSASMALRTPCACSSSCVTTSMIAGVSRFVRPSRPAASAWRSRAPVTTTSSRSGSLLCWARAGVTATAATSARVVVLMKSFLS